ncbi:MAG: hypothetical protein K2M93_02355 [Muribaculaceae bacterium]|nr:hypothetical protein [Muribaculaceae bacterium]
MLYLSSDIRGNNNNYEPAYKDIDPEGKAELNSTLTSLKNQLKTKQTNLTTAQNAQKTAQTNYDNKKKEVDDLQTLIDGYTLVQSGQSESTQEQLKRAYEAAKAEYEQALAEQTKNKNAWDAAKNAANNTADSQYQNVTLLGDIKADVPLGFYMGTINGGGFTITAGSNVDEVFTDFAGTLNDVAVNGAVTGYNATFNNVAYWDSKISDGVYYGAGGSKTEYHDLGALAYNVRNKFGADFSKGILTSIEEGSRAHDVHALTIYRGPGAEQTLKGYYQITSTRALINAKGEIVNVPANHFMLSASADVDELSALIPNVVYVTGEGSRYESKWVEIDLSAESFFSPWDITSNNVTMKGDIAINNRRAGICLPFALKHEYFKEGTSLCTFGQDNGNAFTFIKEDSDIAANTPVLILSDESNVTLDLSGSEGICISRTPDDQIVKGGGDSSDMSSIYGTFKAVTAGEIGERENDDCTVYALKNGIFNAAKQGNFTDGHGYDDVTGFNNVAKFKPFRIVITTRKTNNGGQESASAPRYVSIVDHSGNEISNTSGIDLVKASAESFAVTGGDDEIIITSDADFGMVDVYDLTGRLISTINVLAGENRIAVQNGVYIVAGQKVMVK